MQTKSELRRHLLGFRKKLGREEAQDLSEKVRQNLKHYLKSKKYHSVHCFEPISSLGEIEAIYLFTNDNLFTTRKIDDEWKIVSIDGIAEVPENFDLIIVPMLGFDSSLNRIGYGGGYYDKFLAAQSNALKVGVCLEQGKVEKIPVEEHDIPLDVIITDSAIYQR